MSIRFQLLAGFFILITIFIVNFFINQRLSDQIVKNTAYLNNSEAVIRNSNMLHKEMIEMQSAFRGFLLTGQEVFLEPYYEGIKSLPPLLIDLRSLVSSESQKLKLDSIDNLHREWVDYADALITTRLDTFPEANKMYKTLFETKLRMEVGKKINDRIQKLFQVFDNEEYGLRSQRREVLNTSIERTRLISVSLTLFFILLGLLSSIYFIRNITSRITSMVSLAEKIAVGNFQTIEDTKRDELNKLSLSLNSMSKTLEKNFTELDQFAYVVSHDLKAPLRGIANIISWIEEDHSSDLTSDLKKNLELIKGRALRLEKMINGLLEYAKIGKIKWQKERVDLNKLLIEIVDLIVPETFEVIIQDRLPTLVTEKLQIEQVFSNLISNAVKYNTKEKRTIIISAKNLGYFYSFSVTDNGSGIGKEYFEKIFIIFQTLQERDAFESTGVGLAIAKRTVEEHKGLMSVESEEGVGSVFTFTWPKN
ncbi:histidine kinase [Sphingobacteriaceae bacterium]|nr:histidine kinase [Sphingobacteriaceae bacterium]